MEKKSERLEVRLGHQEKQDFVEACDLQGDNPSGAIRRFINGYVKRSDGDVLASAWRGSARRKLLPAAVIMVGVAILGLTGFWTVKNIPKPNADAIFAYRDVNKDGELDYSEHRIPPGTNGGPNSVMRVLDLDGSGTISRAEFIGKGVMAYALVEGNSVFNEDNSDQEMTLVEFEFTRERVRSAAFSGKKINSDGLDRLVIWPLNGLPTVFEGGVDIISGVKDIEVQADTITVQK